jgi:hypothetical protein
VESRSRRCPAARQAAVHQHYYEVLTPEERNDPQWDPDNVDHWMTFFTERRLAELAHYKGNDPSPPNKNAPTRKVWWGVKGRALPTVLDHIAVGNNPRLTMPQRHWLPHRMDAPASSSLQSSSSVLRTLHGGDGVVIGLPSSAPTRHLRPKKEPGLGTSSARVKKEPGMPASFMRMKKEPISFMRVKKEHGAPAPPSLKKAHGLADEAARQLDY